MKNIKKAFEIYFNMLNHIFIGAASIHVTWYCYQMININKYTLEYNLHVWLSTIGYQLMMADSNGWSFFHSARTKRNIHWIIQVIGSAMAIVGSAILIPTRTIHFKTIHGATGIVSLILTVIALINGIAALWPVQFYSKFNIRPVVSKIFHNFIGIAAFVIGMVSLYYGYAYGYFGDFGLPNIGMDFSIWLMFVVVFTTIVSLFGAIKSFSNQIRIILEP